MDDYIIIDEEGQTTNPNHELVTQTDDLTNQILLEKDPEKLKELTALFEMNQKKKSIARVNKLTKVLEVADDEMANRLTCTPEGIDNSDLIRYIDTAQKTLYNLQDNIAQQPTVQINNQKNEIHIEQSGLSAESRRKVLEVAMSILNKSNNEQSE